jgi:hypothetical protein
MEQFQSSPISKVGRTLLTYGAGDRKNLCDHVSRFEHEGFGAVYRNVLGMKLLYGGEQATFSSLRASDSEPVILNLEQGDTASRWGRLIFHVTDVDAFWTYLKEKGFNPEIPRDDEELQRLLWSAAALNSVHVQ